MSPTEDYLDLVISVLTGHPGLQPWEPPVLAGAILRAIGFDPDESPPAPASAPDPPGDRLTPQWVEMALRDAVTRDCIAFIVVLPVSRELLAGSGVDRDTIDGETAWQAAQGMRKQLARYRAEFVDD